MHLSLRWEMNLLTKFILAWILLNYIRFLGGGMLIMTFTFLRSTSIPLLETMKPNNLPKVTPKEHFWGFNLRLYFLRIPNTSSRSCKWSYPCFDLTKMSLTYTLIGLWIFYEIWWRLHTDKLLLYSLNQKV